MHVVIVGNGVAGMEVALTLRQREAKWRITIVSEESDHFFSRTALMYVLSGQMRHSDIEPLERGTYERLGIERVRARAIGVDPEAHLVRLAGGLPPLEYDRLVLAVGSRPRPAPFWKGYDTLEGIGHFVTLQDLTWLEDEMHGAIGVDTPPRPEAHLAYTTPDSPYQLRPAGNKARGRKASQPVVIGGGLIGIEVIETMLTAGLKPAFLIRDESFWPIAINKDESAWIADRLRHHGVDVRLEHNVQHFDDDGTGNVGAVVTDKGTLDADLVVIAIGVVPNTAWLGDSGIDVDKGGGILVDAQLRASVPDVYACGDCASVEWFNGWVRPQQLWYTGRDQGRVVGANLAGEQRPYGRSTWYNSAKLIDIEYTTVGLVNMRVEGEENWYIKETGAVRSTTRLVTKDDRIIGFNFLGRRWDHEPLVRWIDERRRIDWVVEHLNEARFDTEFVPPLDIVGRLPADLRARLSTLPSS